MKLTKIRNLGRYEHQESMKAVNVKQGTRAGYGTDHVFYLFRGKRVFIPDNEFYSDKWVKIDN